MDQYGDLPESPSEFRMEYVKEEEFTSVRIRESCYHHFFGHCCRAIAYSNMGDFMSELDTIIPESEHADILPESPGV